MGHGATEPRSHGGLLHGGTTERILGAAITVHAALGPGLLESIYEHCLCHELKSRGIEFQSQVPVSLTYGDLVVQDAYRIDLIVEESVIVELKSVHRVLPVHHAQLRTYLRVTGLRVGLLLNFHVPALVEGFSRQIL